MHERDVDCLCHTLRMFVFYYENNLISLHYKKIYPFYRQRIWELWDYHLLIMWLNLLGFLYAVHVRYRWSERGIVWWWELSHIVGKTPGICQSCYTSKCGMTICEGFIDIILRFVLIFDYELENVCYQKRADPVNQISTTLDM